MRHRVERVTSGLWGTPCVWWWVSREQMGEDGLDAQGPPVRLQAVDIGLAMGAPRRHQQEWPLSLAPDQGIDIAENYTNMGGKDINKIKPIGYLAPHMQKHEVAD